MKVKTQLAQLKANCGNITDEEISEWTGIEPQELQDLENGSAQEIKFSTLGKLCIFFQCTPNDLFLIELDETEKNLPPTEEERREAAEIIKRAFAIAEAMPPLPPDEIWANFMETVERIGSQLEKSN